MPNTSKVVEIDPVKEKLIELVDKARRYAADKCHSFMACKECEHSVGNNPRCRNAYIAEGLIANGVTVLPVQVGDTVYGRFRTYGKEVHQCKVVKIKACQFNDRTVRYFLDLEFDIIDPFFRDGRLMRCGMQAIYGEDWGDWYRVYLTREEAETQPPKGE